MYASEYPFDPSLFLIHLHFKTFILWKASAIKDWALIYLLNKSGFNISLNVEYLL